MFSLFLRHEGISNIALMLMLYLPLVTIYNRTGCDYIHPSITQAFTISSAC